jgi:ribosomal-protein-alanine N-acetyltransferase
MTQPVLQYARLEGEIVTLRPVEAADATDAFRFVAGNQSILRWLVWGGPEGVGELEDRFGLWRTGEDERGGLLGARGGYDYQFAVCDRTDGEFAGVITLRFSGHPGHGDVGYWIASEHQGRGLASEAVRLVAHLGFAHLAADVIFGWVFVGNEGSRRVLERNGFTLEYTARGKARKGGKPMDEWYLAQTRWEWESRDGAWRPRAEVRLEPPR